MDNQKEVTVFTTGFIIWVVCVVLANLAKALDTPVNKRGKK